ncbi:glycosyltransferase [Lactobacillus johnsonii]|uniref:Glycosyltransferase n=1 Tax=Lactobacillus johnsonii TaxID=33959 RepID=A1YVC6_LACJH|nr:glycosyltransferase [Lactobacillus johnsonii]ABM21409.1 glycosyltransferase [Lactobacillus johnsonii]MCT3385398.1 glycosyltransferase [Lactobacillus johnsonii]
MTQNSKVSIILPIYNAEKYLEECVKSVITQTYQNIQIILVNDGSKDNSWEICQNLKKKDPRIIAITQKNSGVSVARNAGLNIADGEWIMFVDPDDVLSQDIVEKLLLKTDSDVDIVACTCYGFNENEKKLAHFFANDRAFISDKTDLYLQLLNSRYGQSGSLITAIGVPWGKIYRRSFIDKYELKFDPNLRRMQDNVFNMYAFDYARKIYYLDKPLYFYRIDHVNKYNEKHIKEFKKIFLPVVREQYKCLNELGLYANERIYNEYINEVSNIYLNIIKGIILKEKNTEYIKREINQLSRKVYFKDIFVSNKKAKIQNKKIRLKLFLITHKMEKGYILAYRALNGIKHK